MQVPTAPELDAMLVELREAKATLKAATERAKELGDKVKLTLLERVQAANINDPLTNTEYKDMAGTLVTLKAQDSWRLDVERLKTEHPEVYAAYAVKSTTLVLRV